MANARVVLNRRGFGAVMASQEMEQLLQPYADQVAQQIPGSSVRAVRTGIGSANSRVRLRIESEWHQRVRLIEAIRAVLNNASSR